MRVAVLFNVFAGRSDRFDKYAQHLANVYQGCALITCSGGMGEKYLAPHVQTLEVKVCENHEFMPRIHEAVTRLVEARPDLLVCAGGDGLIAYVADCLIRRGDRIPLLGLAGGTANVGPLIRFTEQELQKLEPSKLRYEPVSAIEVAADGRVLGYAFNDLIIGDTFLSSVDGRMVNISAADFLSDGDKKVADPSRDIVTDDFSVVKNGIPVPVRMQDIAQVVAAPLHKKEFFKGKAITGILCISSYREEGAAIGFTNQILVNSRLEIADEQTFAIEHLLMKEGDTVEMSGFSERGHILIDGNPFRPAEHKITVKYRKDAVTCACME